MTKAQKRVAVAKDVLKQIAARKIIATSGVYSDFTLRREIDREADAQTILNGDAVKKCEACALGSLLISKARLYNDLSFRNVDSIPHTFLVDLFGARQLNAIEGAFEGYGSRPNQAFNWKYQEDEPRLIAIMRNIVRNKGTFKPSAR